MSSEPAGKADQARALVPKLRFPEFRDAGEWNSEMLSELITPVVPPKKLPTSLYATSGAFPIIDQSEDFVCGWTDDFQAVIDRDTSVVVFGDHTCVLKFVDFPFAQGADGIKILSEKSKVSIEYLYQALLHKPLGMVGYRRHFSILKNRVVYFPDIGSNEQQKIADCLFSLDAMITAEGERLAALTEHKKGLMQALFPTEGQITPSLRLPEFQDAEEWTSAELGSVAEVKLGKMLDQKQAGSGKPYPYLNNIAVRWNSINTSNLPEMDFLPHELDRFGLIAGDVLVCEGGEPGRAAVWDGVRPEVMFQKAIHRVRFQVPYESELFVTYLEAIAGTNSFKGIITGEGIKHLTRENFLKMKIPIIGCAERRKINSTFVSLNEVIRDTTAKIDALKTYKSGLMQQLFPSPGEATV